MYLNIIILVVGFIILIKGSDMFVDGSSSIARNLKVSRLLIGLTVVTFGTGVPELALSIKSMLNGNGDIILGNVIGSNIINIILILGISSLIKPLKVKSNTIYKEIPIMILMTLLLTTLFSDNLFNINDVNIITRSDGFVILLFFLVFIYYLLSILRKKVEDDDPNTDLDDPKYPIFKSIIYIILGLIGVVIGSNLVIDNVVEIAHILKVSERLISLTVIAIGTSLPELATSITAARKGEHDLLIGNIVGSNIFNIGIVLGLPIALFGSVSGIGFSYIDLVVLLLSAFILLISAGTKKTINRVEGIIMLSIFIIYYSYILLG